VSISLCRFFVLLRISVCTGTSIVLVSKDSCFKIGYLYTFVLRIPTSRHHHPWSILPVLVAVYSKKESRCDCLRKNVLYGRVIINCGFEMPLHELPPLPVVTNLDLVRKVVPVGTSSSKINSPRHTSTGFFDSCSIRSNLSKWTKYRRYNGLYTGLLLQPVGLRRNISVESRIQTSSVLKLLERELTKL
jgi:hypothetical protein